MATGKILIFIVAYNAEKTIQQVLSRIPEAVLAYDYEILIIDDQSKDTTFGQASEFKKANPEINLKVLYNPANQGYGGNQKLGYSYAIQNNFDAVVLLHGDGQYAPEMLEEMFQPILAGEAEAVFGTRMGKGGDPLKGGMPLYKYAGNRVLSIFQNTLLGMELTEFHSGYRAYSVDALKRMPFQLNTNEFHFDTEIIIQLWLIEARIAEIDIPTYYGDEICHVNGLKYAWDVFRATLGVRLHKMSIFYKRQYDIEPNQTDYRPKMGYRSSHTEAIKAVPENSRVLDVGCGPGHIARALQEKGCEVCGIDTGPAPEHLKAYHQLDASRNPLPVAARDFDCILLLDILEHMDTGAIFQLLDQIRDDARKGNPRLIVSTPNIAFFGTRLQLFTGQFNYGKRGILDLTHQHLFTLSSLKELLDQAGYDVLSCAGIPPPYPEAFGDSWLSQALTSFHSALATLWTRLFAYQLFLVIQPRPALDELMGDAESAAREKSSD